MGLFWAKELDANRIVYRPPPPVPDTRWLPPRDLPDLSAAAYLSIDVEAKDTELQDYGPGWSRGRSHLVGVSIGTPEGNRWYFPIRHEFEAHDNLEPSVVLRWLTTTLSNPHQPKLGAGLIYDVGTLRAEGIRVEGELVDVQYAEALLSESDKVSLEALGQRYLGQGKKSTQLYEWCAGAYGGSASEKQRANIWRAPPRLVGPYAESDAHLPGLIARLQYPRLQAEGLYDLFRMECALIPLLVDMRFAGVTVDIAKAEQVRETLRAGIAEESAKLAHIVGFEVEVNAAVSIARAFDSMGLNYNKTTKGQPSFTKEFLEHCRNPVADSINKIRQLTKLKSTFVESYILDSNVKGKIFCSFNPMREDASGTRSGRFSSDSPNLQNIPSRDPYWGSLLRSLFIPDTGHASWRKYDYSQIEYRMLIHFAVGPGADQARAMFRANPDTDYHDWALDLVAPYAGWDVSTAKLRKQWRKPVKTVNFGLVFGEGEAKLAASLGLSKQEAQKLFSAYHRGVPFVRPTMHAASDKAQRLGYIKTLLGRRSRFDLWEPSTFGEKEKPLAIQDALREYGRVKRAHTYIALNRELQGSAADMLKVAMLRCYYEGVFAQTGVPRLTIHDELDFSDPGGRDVAFREMKHIMETAISVSIPIRADGDIGPNWGNCSAIEN